MVPVQNSLTARTAELPFRQWHLLPVSAPRTVLARVGRVDLHHRSTGAFCLEEQQGEEQRPRRIADALGETANVDHAVDFQVFNREEAEPIDKLPRRLVGEVQTAEADPLVDTGNRLPSLGSFWRAFLGSTQTALGFGKRLFIRAEESRILHNFPTGQCGERVQADIDAGLLLASLEGLWLGNLAREASVPFAGRRTADRAGLGLAFPLAMQDHLDRTDLGQPQETVPQFTTGRHLRERHAVVAIAATKSRITWLLARLDAAEECLESQVDADGDVLQDLAMDIAERRALFLESWNCPLLIVQSGGFLVRFVGSLTDFQEVVVQPAAFLKLLAEKIRLLLRGIQAITERFTYGGILSLN
jgi:hypothetical protein